MTTRQEHPSDAFRELAGTDVTVVVEGTGGCALNDAGDPIATRTSLWFAVAAAFPEVTVGP